MLANLEGANLAEPCPLLNERRISRGVVIGSHRCRDQGIDPTRGDPRVIECREDRGGGELGGSDARHRDVPLSHAAALDDPLVTGFHDPCELIVGDDLLGQGNS